jgi:hypothetical protein
MTDFLIRDDGDGWDIVIEDGDFVFTADEGRLSEVGQRVIYRLMTWQGESAYDTTAGVPYLDAVFGAQVAPGVAQLLTQIILETEGVDALVDTPTFTLTDRGLAVSMILVEGDDIEEINFEVLA